MNINQYAVYQLKESAELAAYRSRSYQYLTEHHFQVIVQNYQQAYFTKLFTSDTPEIIRKRLEEHRPKNFRGRPFGVGDVIVINQQGEITAYFVDKDSLVVVAGFIRSSSSGILVTLDTKNLFIDGCAGTWVATEECVVESQHFFLMQHEVYKEKAPNVIVDASGKLVSTEIRKGLDEDARKKILDYLHCRKVAFINEETYSGLTLDDERIRQAIIEFRPRLVVIDPIQAYLGSDSDLQIAGRARKLMQRLGMWASVYDCAIVLIGHLNKKEGTKGLYRSLGSIDVVAAARSVLQVERDQKDTDIRIVRQIKNSLAPSDGEIRFSITAEMGFQWLECKSTFVSSEQPKVPEFESKTEKAAYLIKKLLSDGDMRAREIYMRMKDEGISRRTAENTKKELGIRSYRKMRQWYWSIHTGE